MIEPIIYMAIGFLVSMLISLMILPLVHNRAVRLTTRRLEAAAPVSKAEIQADKDQLRAEFAMAARRLELSIEQLKGKSVSQLAELGKKTDAINRMKLELGEKTAAIFALETREKALQEQLRAIAEPAPCQSTEQAVAENRDELTRLNRELADRSQAVENQHIELNAARMTIETLKGRVEDSENQLASTRRQLDQQRAESATTANELTEARARVETLSQRVSDLDRQLVEQVKATESQASRADELSGVMAAAKATPPERDATGASTAETAERSGNALLRERINDVAAEVARLAITLEGPDSPIKAILAADPPHPAKSANDATIAVEPTLADRIRTLQARATYSRGQPG